MQSSIYLSNATRLILIAAVIAVIVAAIHLTARSEKLQRRRAALPIACLCLLCAGFALLFGLSHGSPDPQEAEGFAPFAPDELSAAAELMGEAISGEYFSPGDAGGRVELNHFDIVFEDGAFDRLALSASFTSLNPDADGSFPWWQRAMAINRDGEIYRFERAGGGGRLDGLPAETALDALRGLEGLGWCDTLGVAPSAVSSVTLSSGRSTAASLAGQPAWALAGGGLVPLEDYSGTQELFYLAVTAGSAAAPSSYYILLDI